MDNAVSSGHFSVVVLAGERPGGSELSRQLGLPASVLVEVNGKPALARVIEALEESQETAGGVLAGPAGEIFEGTPQFREILDGTQFHWIEPAAGPSASALAGIEAVARFPVLLTAGDHALLTSDRVDHFCREARMRDCDVAVGLVPFAAVHSAWPGSKRTVLRFADGEFCGSNLFAVLNEAGTAGPRFWRELESLRKKPWKMAGRIGAGVLLRYLFGRLTLAQALDKFSQVAGCRVRHVLLTDPRLAVDVDSLADRHLAERVLRAEQAESDASRAVSAEGGKA
jgi:molybdopterin-guanine dinucleotide biosynthesis protein A